MVWNCVSHRSGGPRIPSQSAKSRSGRSVAASSASKPAWSEVDDGIKRDPNAGDPVPVRGADADIARVLHVETFEPDPKRHEEIFGRAGDEVEHVHAQRGPD